MTTALEGGRRKAWGESSGHFAGEHAAQGQSRIPASPLRWPPPLHLRWELSYPSLERVWLTVLCPGGWPGPHAAGALWGSLAEVWKSDTDKDGDDGEPSFSSRLRLCPALCNLISVPRPRDVGTLILPLTVRETEARGQKMVVPGFNSRQPDFRTP